MRNLKASRIDITEFINEVIESKKPRNDATYKQRCHEIYEEQSEVIRNFDTAFRANNIEIFDKEDWDNDKHIDFTSLYKYTQTPFKRLRDSVICDDHNRRDDTCPLCDLNRIGTLDHFLPKEHFASFVIHPRNLVPCCSTCNGHKSTCWHDDGNRKIWNAYLNALPSTQYLFCDITITDALPSASYRIEQGEIDNTEFALIQRTFKRLHLIERYNAAAYSIMAKFMQTILLHLKSCSRYTFEENIALLKEIESASGIMNNWEHVLKMSMLQSQSLIKLIRQNLWQQNNCNHPIYD